MKNRSKLATFHEIFWNIVSDMRIPISSIAKNMGHTGRGRRRSTISNYVNEMYQKEISFKPRIVMKTYKYPKRKMYFCKKAGVGIAPLWKKLKEDERIQYSLILSGPCDFIIISRDDTLYLEKDFGLQIVEESLLYTPIYTLPKGWNISFKTAAKNALDIPFKKGLFTRKIDDILIWTDLTLRIFELMHEDARVSYTDVADKTDVYSSTVRNHLEKYILPRCEIAHFFFPKGYKNYMKNFFRIYTHYEQSLVKAFEKLPCTTYVYPLEEGIAFNVFHEDINMVMTMLEKMRENGFLEDLSLFTPLRYWE
jgi:hypothetical protein